MNNLIGKNIVMIVIMCSEPTMYMFFIKNKEYIL